MKKTYRIGQGDLAFVIVIVFLAGFIGGTYVSPNGFLPRQSETQQVVSVDGEKVVEMGLPAIDTEGKGVLGKLVTTIRPGSGQVLVNVNNVLAQFDTQLSGRVAAQAAAEYAKADLGGIDIIYDMQVNATIIEGPSAGATMAASIVLALTDIPNSDSIMITGTIREDGTIGPVGGILEKAKAAKEAGATIFLVPPNQASELRSNRAKTCRDVGSVEVCRIIYEYDRVNVGASINITVAEVSNLTEAIDFFVKESGEPDISV